MTDLHAAVDESEWEVLSNEPSSPSFGENTGLWFEPHRLIRTNYFALSRCGSTSLDALKIEETDDAQEEEKEIPVDLGGRGIELVSGNSFLVNPVALSAFQFDDITFHLPDGLRIGPVCAPTQDEFVDKRCDSFVPNHLDSSMPPVSSLEFAGTEHETEVLKEKSIESEFPKASELESEPQEEKIQNENTEDIKASENKDRDPVREENLEKEKAEEQTDSKAKDDSEKCAPFHPLAALCSFGVAAAAMGILTIAKALCRGDAEAYNSRVVHPHMLGFHPQILRFDVCSEHRVSPRLSVLRFSRSSHFRSKVLLG
eukprot:TRINITY_DN5525_c0_g1_i1.p1 TRINITY_DN5525_c0_g1~~TRINITY_DN5525_c0_g1_i1.p1  ORF type:complete len:314 (-),score=34.64 TRINITY_DN5525_c0_g1_i1:487-1428(-)